MGGKTKQTQRTKNNSRPSNSGRSAELFGTTLPTFVGFTSLGHCGGGGSLPSATATSDIPVLPLGFTMPLMAGAHSPDGSGTAASPSSLPDDVDTSTIDSTYQIVLRKMTKKDPTTKVKALVEFADMVNGADVDTVTAVLPFWPRLYQMLSTDVEHRVREASQQAQAAIASKCGKKIAPYLRQLAPAWITGQYDTYAPAASIATASFQRAFRPYKQQEVFTFCHAEILDYVVRNVIVATPQTMASSKSYTIEECESKYQRIVTCSLKGYAQYLSKMPEDQLKAAAAIASNASLIENPKFWSFHKHKVAHVRAAFFEALSAALQFAPHLLAQHEAQATASALQTLDESEPVVLPHVWASILLVTQKIENWTQHINMEKALLPKLWKVLKTGGGGNASVIYPHLLPLLAKLNRAALGEKLQTFYTDFFANMNAGLLARARSQSRSDLSAIATALFECLQYVIIQIQRIDTFPRPEDVNTFATQLLQAHIIDVITWTLTSTDSSHSGAGAKFIFNHISNLCNYWTLTRAENELYRTLLADFWSQLPRLFDTSLDQVDANRLERTLDQHFEFVQCLRATIVAAAAATKPKTIKVKFAAPPNDVDEIDASNESGGGQADGNAAAVAADNTAVSKSSTMDDINEVAHQLCTIYMRRTTESLSPLYINNLENLFKTFGSRSFFERLAAGDNLMQLYDKISTWLLISQLRQENVVDIILQLYPHLRTADERSVLLKKLINFPKEQVQTWTIARLLSHPLCAEPNTSELLRMPNVTKVLLKCAESVAAGDTKDNINFLHKCFFQNEAGDILIDANTCRAIVEVIAAVLQRSDGGTAGGDGVLDTCASFLAQIMPVICSDEANKELQHFMFMQFFEFSICKQVSDDLSEDTLWEITTSWQDALSSNDLRLSDKLLAQCSAIIDAKMKGTNGGGEESAPTMTIDQLENVAEIVSKLILCAVECVENEVEKYAQADAIVDRIFNVNMKELRANVGDMENLCMFLESINGRLTVPTIGHRTVASNDVNAMERVDDLLKWAVFKFNVVFKLTCSCSKKQRDVMLGGGGEMTTTTTTTTGEDDVAATVTDNVDDECTEDFCDVEANLIKTWSDQLFDEILDGIYVAGLGDSLLRHSAVLPEVTENRIINLSESVVMYLQNISAKNAAAIKEKLFAAAATKGSMWSLAILFLANIEPYDDGDRGLVLLYEDATLNCAETVAYANILQCFTSRLGARMLPITRNLISSSAVNATDDGVIDDSLILQQCVAMRCLIQNYSQATFNAIEDGRIVDAAIALLQRLYAKSKKDKPFFLYNEDISNTKSEQIILISEIANLLATVIRSFPATLDTNEWDLIRIAVSSWVLTLSKSSENFHSVKVAVFISSIYKLFGALSTFIVTQKRKSSTVKLTTIIEEWEHLFAKDVNLILLKCYLKLVTNQNKHKETDHYFIEALSTVVHTIDFQYVLAANRIDSKTSMDDLILFALDNIGHVCHNVRMASVCIVKKLSKGLIAKDLEQMLRLNDSDEVKTNKDSAVGSSSGGAAGGASIAWHLLHKFDTTIRKYNEMMAGYTEEFSFKTIELDHLSDVPANLSIPYLLLWDCVLDICSKALPELRSTYAAYLTEHQFVQTMLPALFRLMPVEILRSQDAKQIGQTYFTPLTMDQIMDDALSPERYACHIYVQTLRHLPAAARKWWHDSTPGPKTMVDKITTSFVSAQLCQDELRSLVEKKEKHENMQLTVHTSTREVLATYIIDEARMELIVTLPVNHPLGSVKVDSGKQIGGRLQSRVLVMQLTIFLTHQNGSIADGLSLWKRNLDRKFEGVQECYVCYSVIHQDTCQLPKLTCRKCKNKFHGPCLYKWFSTSNKSTCPICRNIF